MRKLMARAVRGLNPDHPLDVSLYGGQARLHHTGNNSEIKALMAPHRYAREEYAFCCAHMPKTEGVFLDIGANAGVFSLFMAAQMRSGTLLAVEPQPDMFARLKQNFGLNPDIEKRLDLKFENIAVGGSEKGHLKLAVPDSAGQASARFVGEAAHIEVPQIPMHTLFSDAGIEKLDVLKIDVEGFEDAILFPFFDNAPDPLHPRAIVMEACHADRWQQDCQALLRAQGYAIVHHDRTNMMLLKEPGQ